jgi:WD40 repeat protein
MKEFKPLEIKKFAKKSYKNNEMKKYKKFKEVEKQNLSLSCGDVKFCIDNPNLLIYFALDTLYYFDISTNTTISNYPMSTGQITAGNIRRDGRIILTGYVNGKINAYEASKKLVLKNFSNHKLQVNSIEFSDNIINFISSSNDMVNKYISNYIRILFFFPVLY